MVSVEELDELVAEVQKEDFCDFTDLPIDELALRRLSCIGALQLLNDMQDQGLDSKQQLLCLLASMAKLLSDNTLLHVRVLQHTEPAGMELTKLLARLRHS